MPISIELKLVRNICVIVLWDLDVDLANILQLFRPRSKCM